MINMDWQQFEKKMLTGDQKVPKLSSKSLMYAIALILGENGYCIDPKDFRYSDKESMLYYGKKRAYCYDRQHHTPNSICQSYAEYEFLKSVEDLIKNSKWCEKLKIPKST